MRGTAPRLLAILRGMLVTPNDMKRAVLLAVVLIMVGGCGVVLVQPPARPPVAAPPGSLPALAPTSPLVAVPAATTQPAPAVPASVLPVELPPPTAESLCNRAILDAPLLGHKLIMAHYMTGWVGDPAAEPLARTFTPVPPGSAAEVVGTKSGCPLYGVVDQPPLLDLDAAVLRDLKAATAMGVDGFQFFYPMHMHDGFMRRYSTVVRAFIKQAELHYPNFRVSLCLCAPNSPGSEPAMRAFWATHIRWILADTADSPIWLRTPDGRLLFYLWVPEGLVDAFRAPGAPHIHHRAGIAATAVTYELLAREIGQPIAYVFHMRGRSDDDYANTVFDYFPAAWRWTEGDLSADAPRLATLARARHRVFSTSVYPGFYGHTYKQDDHGNGSGKVGRDPIEQLWRPYTKTRQTQLFRNLLTSSIAADTPLINIITWNDYTEATQICPDVNYNFAWGVLLTYYKNLWLGQPARNDHELALIAYKKHPLDQLLPTDVGIHVSNAANFGTLAEESQGEVVTILQQPAEVWVNDTNYGTVAAGLVSTPLPFIPGQLRLQLKRAGQVVLQLAPSEWATTTPRRNDPVSVVLSTDCDRYFRTLFGPTAVPYQLREYAPAPAAPSAAPAATP